MVCSGEQVPPRRDGRSWRKQQRLCLCSTSRTTKLTGVWITARWMTTVGEVNHERNGFDPPLEPAFADQLGVRLGVPDYVPGIGRSRESRTPVPVKLMSCATPKIHIA